MPDATRHYGKYRGTVVVNVDPDGRGRIQVRVPDVLGEVTSSWAMPCFPFAGPQLGFYVVPPVGAGVWVEFEQGDVSWPIWAGCWYGSQTEVPADAKLGNPAQPDLVVQTQGGRTLVMSDLPGGEGITLKAGDASIVVNDVGITIDNGRGATISLIGSRVAINQGAFAVT